MSSKQPKWSNEDKTRIVLSVLRGEVTIAEAGRQHAVSQTSIASGGIRSWMAVRRRWRPAAPARQRVGSSSGSSWTSSRSPLVRPTRSCACGERGDLLVGFQSLT